MSRSLTHFRHSQFHLVLWEAIQRKRQGLYPFTSFNHNDYEHYLSSGINGAGTTAQQEQGIPDNAKIFYEDTLKSVSI